MDLGILEKIAITAAANAAIAGRDTSGFWPDASVFVFTRRCSFVGADGEVLAADPIAWLTWAQRNAIGARLHAIVPVHPSGARRPMIGVFGSDPRWIIETIGPGGLQHWEGRLASDRSDVSQQKSYETTFRRLPVPVAVPEMRDVTQLSAEMRERLTDIAAFAHELKSEVFEGCFRRALGALDGVSAFENDDIPHFAQFSPEAGRLYNAARSAWVFGGMGAWNDTYYDGRAQTRYDELTYPLYDLLVESAAAVASSTFPT